MPPRRLYVSFVQGGVFGFSIVPLHGLLDEPAVRVITKALEEQTSAPGRRPKPLTVISFTVLEDQADNPRYH